MMVLVDTSVWSVALRKDNSRHSKRDANITQILTELIEESRVTLAGPIRQELLSGITHESQYERLKQRLQSFRDIPIETEDYESAAQLFNLCRRKGVQGSHIDFLICALAKRHALSIFTLDFDHYSKHVPLSIMEI